MAIEVFKVLHGLCPPALSNIVQKWESSYNFRYSNILQVPTILTSTFGKSCIRYEAPVLWNSHPDDFRKCSDFNQLKSLILSWNGKCSINLSFGSKDYIEELKTDEFSCFLGQTS